jgi:hypothetical protein
MSSNRELVIGHRVRLIPTGEVGIVVWIWPSEEADFNDTYVTFFGQEFPSSAPHRIPYVLRYAETSLELLDP